MATGHIYSRSAQPVLLWSDTKVDDWNGEEMWVAVKTSNWKVEGKHADKVGIQTDRWC